MELNDKRVVVNYPKHSWKLVFLALFLVPGYLLDEARTWRPTDGTAVPGFVDVLHLNTATGQIAPLPLKSHRPDGGIQRLDNPGDGHSFLIEQRTGRYFPFVDRDHYFEVKALSKDEIVVTNNYQIALLNHAEVHYRATDQAIELIHARSGLSGYLIAFVFAGLTVVALRVAIGLAVALVNGMRKIVRN